MRHPGIPVALAACWIVRQAAGQSVPAEPAPASQPAMGSIAVEVVRDGKAASGATVRVLRAPGHGLPMDLPLAETEAPVEVANAQTGADGRCRVPAADGDVVFLAAELGTDAASLRTGPMVAGDSAVVRLLPARMLIGRVLEQAVPPVAVAGASVCAALPAATLHPGPCPVPVPWFAATTDAEGQYRILVPIHEELAVSVCHHGRIARGTGDVTLPAEALVRGQLVDRATGNPIPGVVVEPNYDFEGGAAIASAAGVVTGADGCFEVRNAVGGALRLIPREHRRTAILPDDLIRVPGGKTPRYALDPGARWTARLIGEHGAPLAGCQVLLCGALHRPGRALPMSWWWAAADGEGRVHIGCFSAGETVMVWAVREGTASFLWRDQARDGEDAGDLCVDQSDRLTGRVLGPAGAPVPGAEVLLLPDEARDRRDFEVLPRRRVLCDGRGRFVATGLCPGLWNLAAMSRDFAPGFEQARTGAPVVEVRLTAGIAIRGRVVERDGTGVPGAQVHGLCPRLPPGDLRFFGLGHYQCLAEADGSFVLRGIPTGLRIVVYASKTLPGGRWLGAVPGYVVAVAEGIEGVEITGEKR